MREPGSGTRAVVQRMFARHSLSPRVRMELNSDEAICEAIAAGLGISILSRYSVAMEPAGARLVCLDVEGFPLESQWHFVYPVGKHLSVCGARVHGLLARRSQSSFRGEPEAGPHEPYNLNQTQTGPVLHGPSQAVKRACHVP